MNIQPTMATVAAMATIAVSTGLFAVNVDNRLATTLLLTS